MKNKLIKIDIMTSFFRSLKNLAIKDKSIFFITADHGAWALAEYKKSCSRQYLNIGISEQNMVSVAAGMALNGHKVFIFTITPFLIERAFEQIKMDISYANLPITIVGNGSTLTYANHGASHQAIEDLSLIRALPNFTIINPSTNKLAQKAVSLAYKSKKPTYIKLDKGFFPNSKNIFKTLFNGCHEVYRNNILKNNCCIICTGTIVHNLQKLIEDNKALQNYDLFELFIIKPINEKKLLNLIKNYKNIVTIEEQHITGGISSIISFIIAKNKLSLNFDCIAINDNFIKKHGNREWLRKQYKLDDLNIFKKLKKIIKN